MTSTHRNGLGLMAAALASATAVAQNPQNCLVVIADDFGVDQLGVYGVGATVASTPTIDGLAARGLTFEQAWANPTCSPTRASLYTGRHAFRHGIGAALLAGDPGLPRSETILPEVLDAAGSGYAHALIGKWHLDDSSDNAPNLAGWSHFAGGLEAAVPSYYDWTRVENGVAAQSTNYATTQQVDDALAWIDRQSEPWFCVLAFNAPHTPYEAPPAALHTVDLSRKTPVTHPRDFYRAMVQAMDTELGRMLASLGPRLGNTNVIFVGDNGTPVQIVESPLSPGQAKGTVYQGGVRVPLIVAGPAVSAAAGARATALVEVVDLFPTVLSLCGVDPAAAGTVVDGSDLQPLFADPTQAGEAQAYSEQFGDQGLPDGAAIRDDGYKLIENDPRIGGSTFEFYDLGADPWEQNDLNKGTLTAAEAARFEDLRAALARQREEGLFVEFGSGCGGVLLQLDGPVAGPMLGETFSLQVRGVSRRAQGIVGLLGLSRTVWAGVPLPLDLDFAGMPGCQLLVAVGETMPLPPTSPTVDWDLPIPNDPNLLGAEFFTQALVAEPNANPAGAVVSNAGRAVIGSGR